MDDSLLIGSGSGTPVKDEFWTPELEIKLAEKIRSFPCLYDSTHEDWKNKPYRQDLWEMIAAEMRATAEQCKKKYKGLRDKAVREYRLGKDSKWPAAEAMRFVLPLARIRHENNKKPSKSGGNYDDSNNYGFDSGSFDVDDNEQDDADGYNHRSALIPGTTIPNIVPPIVQPQPQPGIHSFFNGFNHLALPKYDHNPASSKRKSYEGDEYHQYGDYYNQAKNMKLPSKSSSVIISRPQPLPVTNGFNLNLNHLSSTMNSNQQPPIYKPPNLPEVNGSGSGNGTASSRRSSTSTSQSHQNKHGSSYYFGQYIASALDTLPNEASNDAKQRIQDILFKVQVKHAVHKTGSGGGRKSEGSHPVVVFDETTGREQVMEIEKDMAHAHAHSKN